ncbi:hypothetical protein N8I77_009933 [Diaporthe amygdali]|uniref:Phosphatidylglycerol/phosphatidylinositol transfer protein n=1 Tax=Phomopsis amygdali TaxID=1214568 RepID=A0AAD9S799_PHOAM|nr:hypothetical protein N8I77_009933 [Diaporthe amygdali]
MRSKLTSIATLFLLQAGLLAAGKKVPGDNPLSFCSENLEEDIIQIDELTLIPNPPVRGKSLAVKAEGRVTQTIDEGASVHIVAWKGSDPVFDETFDLCDDLDMIGEECPVEAGPLSMDEEIPLEEEDLPAVS